MRTPHSAHSNGSKGWKHSLKKSRSFKHRSIASIICILVNDYRFRTFRSSLYIIRTIEADYSRQSLHNGTGLEMSRAWRRISGYKKVLPLYGHGQRMSDYRQATKTLEWRQLKKRVGRSTLDWKAYKFTDVICNHSSYRSEKVCTSWKRLIRKWDKRRSRWGEGVRSEEKEIKEEYAKVTFFRVKALVNNVAESLKTFVVSLIPWRVVIRDQLQSIIVIICINLISKNGLVKMSTNTSMSVRFPQILLGFKH